MTYKELKKICEELNWKTYPSGNMVEIRKYSPAGEDFSICIDKDGDFVGQIEDYADNFDVDEHVEMWVEAKKNGVSGVPSISDLVDDAKDIRDMLYELVNAVNGLN